MLAGKLDDATMQRLNFAIDHDKRSPADVARRFLQSEGLLAEWSLVNDRTIWTYRQDRHNRKTSKVLDRFADRCRRKQ